MIISLSTWKHGFHPNRITFEALQNDKSALDAVELGAQYCEADITCMSVGRGGLPDAAGEVTLDASIMDHAGNCGSVVFVRNYEHVISIARRVMEKTPHVMLAGDGAERFAALEGFPTSDLLTEKAKALWDQWMKQPDKLQVRLRRAEEGEHEYVFYHLDEEGKENQIDRDNPQSPPAPALKRRGESSHDTIGILGLDTNGHLAGACTTSGLAFKIPGRVGDSPIIGSGLFVDGNVAAAVGTGNGELMMRACSAFHIVEMVRQGIDPKEALGRAMQRIEQDPHLTDDMQAGLMVIRKDGVWAARGLRPGFQLAAATSSLENQMFDID
ncbi:MAG TPA: N(4)-(beta-N-acetylglucosaminyl)-L-asparaginase [Candidatus Kapabacteria bacterium]